MAKLTGTPKVVRREIHQLTPEQAKERLKQARGTREEGPFTLAFALGLRVAEILGLRWEDVDLTASVVHVRQA